jgi:NADPH-dependent glutamate synthase beta subunit-like oxidoreductase
VKKPFAITLDAGTSVANLTGSWRTSRPVYVDRLPPCNQACPAGENIQAWLYEAEEGNYQAAWEEIMKNNPLPAIMGRVCYHPCENACNRDALDESVGIHAVERFLGDLANREGWKVPIEGAASGKKVLVVGSGPAGLSAAYHLTRMGHTAVIYEASALTGGMMRYGIPKYRLPRKTLDTDIQRIKDMGVEIKVNSRVENLADEMKSGGFDAAFIAVGAHLPRTIDVTTKGTTHVVEAVNYLRSLEDAEPMQLGERVVVYGGGNTAMDVARSAIRLGKEVTVVVRGKREKMAAHAFEVHEALEEGVVIKAQRVVRQLDVNTLLLEVMAPDAKGNLQPSGETEMVECDTLVMAVGQMVELDIVSELPGITITDGVVEIGADMMTDYPGVFAGGDMVPSARTVTTGIGHGKKAARNIDAYLRSEKYVAPAKAEVASFDRLNTWYYSDADKTVQPMLDVVRRQSGFEEVLGDLTEANALFEARRCLSCGNCFECDTCYGVCPDNAVLKLGYGNRYEFKLDYCKGCGLCVAECPCGAIRMEAETI